MPRPAGLIVAIDGVVGAGKSSTARRVAARLGYRHLDTGAMYRAVTLKAVRCGVAADDTAGLQALLADLALTFKPGGRVWLDGEDVTEAIRQPQIARRIGAYADRDIVRREMVCRQQALGAAGGVVAEGRDMATVVFPDAELKIRLTASLDERTRRRHDELAVKGVEISPAQVRADIRARDLEDAARDYGAVAQPGTWIELDTTELTLEQQVERIVALARERGA